MPPQIISFTQTLLTSGLQSAPSANPLASLCPTNTAATQYLLVIQIYIPDTSTADLSMDITTILPQPTQAGTLNLRQFSIQYTDPNAGTTTYSFWSFNIIYDLNDGPSAQGVYVNLTGWLPSGGIPTSRGTVTIVATT